MIPPYNYVALVPYRRDIHMEVLTAWCEEHFGPDGGDEWWWVPAPNQYDSRLVFFRDQAALVAFKLQFGNMVGHALPYGPNMDIGPFNPN